MSTMDVISERKNSRFGAAALLAGLAALGLCGYFASALVVDRTSAAMSTEQTTVAADGCVGCADKATMRAFAHRQALGETSNVAPAAAQSTSPAAPQDNHP